MEDSGGVQFDEPLPDIRRVCVWLLLRRFQLRQRFQVLATGGAQLGSSVPANADVAGRDLRLTLRRVPRKI